MGRKPKHAAEYTSEQAELVRATCLYVATKLGDLADDIVIVGGLVPSLLVDQDDLPEGVDPHVGTMDLDVGLELALLSEARYRALSEALRAADFEQDVNEAGKRSKQRWCLASPRGKITVDFLIQPSLEGDEGGKLRHIEADFAAFIVPGMRCAFRDRQRVKVVGKTPFDEKAEREPWVCGPGAYVVLKALAFDKRGENKDAYDLFYVVRNYGAGVDDVAASLRPLLDDPDAKKAIAILERDFLDRDKVGPMRVAAFLAGGTNLAIQEDVVGFVTRLLSKLGEI